jgi:SSS family solute:Na+ symporter
VILGMLWKRATKAGGFWGLLAGTASSITMFVWVHNAPSALKYVAMSADAQPMAENLYRALWSWIICVVVTVVVSMMTKATPEAELANLVYGVTAMPDDGARTLWQKPLFWAIVVIVVFFVLNLIFF